MSYVGRSKGNILSHCWFYESARRSLLNEELGEICGGITVLTLTAFMVEIYINYCCESIFDIQTRVNEVLDDGSNDLFERVDNLPKDLGLEERVAIGYGFKEQSNELVLNLSGKLHGNKKAKFERLLAEQTSDKVTFNYLDDELRFSPIAKFDAVSKVIYTNETSRLTHFEIVKKLFKSRNLLAHGKSEFCTQEFRISSDKPLEPKHIPLLKASWQEQCSLRNAKELHELCCEIICYISKQAFENSRPFSMPCQLTTVTMG
ncbi:hypothetical protein M2R28_02400 [Aeromonas hydrophila]|uniref:hypothetical protein n=1 Tax=Aeromonas hydrophila TaxID=644 RepID=UPI00208EEFB3|nr:hypothetical protein [Aeromonas hydrophila]MCO4198538.1 hypothetical protein [Aeromonas hydrophila]